MEILNRMDTQAILARLGPQAWINEIDFSYEQKRFFYKTKDLVKYDRMGEVVFAVERPNGRFICVRSKEYPEGIYRIPTGGVGHKEDILNAVTREVMEELGIRAEVKRFLGINQVRMTYKDEAILFYSFFFHLKETGGNLLTDATDEEVSEVLEAGEEDLFRLSDELLEMGGEWRDWGRFRYLTTHTIALYVSDLNNKVL